jgi:hypothetical protein
MTKGNSRHDLRRRAIQAARDLAGGKHPSPADIQRQERRLSSEYRAFQSDLQDRWKDKKR